MLEIVFYRGTPQLLDATLQPFHVNSMNEELTAVLSQLPEGLLGVTLRPNMIPSCHACALLPQRPPDQSTFASGLSPPHRSA